MQEKYKPMTKDIIDTFAIVRDVPESFRQCVSTYNTSDDIDTDRAILQHQLYCNTLSSLGLNLIRLDADDSLPDCCFTEDTVLIIDDLAIITNPGIQSRVAETVALEKTLSLFKDVSRISLPGTLDGGDVLKIEKTLYIGISSRTNAEGMRQVASVLEPRGYWIKPVEIRNTLHLKSVCTYLGNGLIILAEGYFDVNIFSGFEKIIVPKEEEYCANCLVVHKRVIIPKGFPITKALIEEKGLPVIELEMSEFRKADGALTCLSVIF
jgi:dimethylargininase